MRDFASGLAMPKTLLLLFTLFFISGCTILSKEHYLSVNHASADYETSACGYYSTEWIRFGRGNLSRVRTGDVSLELCATDYYSNPGLQGFIIPFLPTSMPTYTGHPVFNLTNTSKEKSIRVELDFLLSSDEQAVPSDVARVEFCAVEYLKDTCKTLYETEGEQLVLPPGDSIWVRLKIPEFADKAPYKIKLYTENNSFIMDLVKKQSLTVWVFTV